MRTPLCFTRLLVAALLFWVGCGAYLMTQDFMAGHFGVGMYRIVVMAIVAGLMWHWRSVECAV